MVTYVLDASALVRFLEGDATAERVRQILMDAAEMRCRVVISAINWGEVIGVTAKRQGRPAAGALGSELALYRLDIVPVTAERAQRSATIKLDLKVPYADCFAIELASTADHVLVTADFDFKPAAQAVTIEFLPAKAKL